MTTLDELQSIPVESELLVFDTMRFHEGDARHSQEAMICLLDVRVHQARHALRRRSPPEQRASVRHRVASILRVQARVLGRARRRGTRLQRVERRLERFGGAGGELCVSQSEALSVSV